MITTSEATTKVIAAIAQVQAEVGSVTKNAQNPHFRNNYTDLNGFLHALAGPLERAGLTLIQGPGMREGWVTVDTLLAHVESGEWVKSEAGSPMPKADPQGAGSAITYLRRYSLAALFSLPQEDDDGNAGSGVGRDVATGQPRQRETVNRSTGEIKPAAKNGAADSCPECGGGVWDNREKKRSGQFSAKSPDYSCRDKDGCGWAMWVESATKDLEAELNKLVAEGLIQPASVEVTMQNVMAGDLTSFRLAHDWIATKRGEAQPA